MCFGSGSGSSSPPPDNSMNAPGTQEAINAARDAATEKQQRIDLYNQRLQAAMANAPAQAGTYAAQAGMDPNSPQIQQIIQQIVGNISASTPRDQDTTTDPSSYFSPQAFVQGFGDAQSVARNANASKVRGSLAPTTANSLLPDNMIDSIVNDIVGEQRGLANTTVGYQSKRGLLTPQGSEQATKSLDNQDAAARSTASSLASGVLGKDRGNINDIISRAGTDANSWMLGNPDFSIDPYQSEINSTAGRETASFGGDTRAALGDTNLFNIPQIVAQAGQAQGAQNLTPGSELAPIPGGQKKAAQARGVGAAGGSF